MTGYIVTTFEKDGRLAEYTAELASVPDEQGQELHLVNLYPQVRYQTFLGFGGAITEAVGLVLQALPPETARQVLNSYYGPSGIGYSLVRTHLDSCDFSRENYCAIEDEDTDFSTFSLRHDERNIIPYILMAEELAGKKLPVMLSPWSPPAFMKTNGSRNGGGKLRLEYADLWARYICKYIHEYRRRGVQVTRLSIQNEPNAAQTWDSCLYSAQEERDFLIKHLHPALVENGLGDLEVFVWDHNKERLYERAVETIDSETEKMITGMAFHWYSGDHFEEMELVRKRFPGLKLILSESCLEYCKFRSDDVTEGVFSLLHELIGDLNHGMSMFHDWNLCLDEEGGPNYVGNYCHAPCLFHKGKKRLLPQPTLDCFYHISHYLRPGSVRIAHSVYTDKIESVAYKNTDGSIILVILNRTEKQLPVNLRLHGQTGTLNVLPQSCTIEYE